MVPSGMTCCNAKKLKPIDLNASPFFILLQRKETKTHKYEDMLWNLIKLQRKETKTFEGPFLLF